MLGKDQNTQPMSLCLSHNSLQPPSPLPSYMYPDHPLISSLVGGPIAAVVTEP